jgi:hypothetical protein
MRRLGLATAIALGSLLLTGCSQIDSLTPVGGAAVTSVRNATYDVLVQEQVSILEAPVCESTDSGFTCTGSTTDGEAIVATAGSTSPYPLTIMIGERVLFDGTATDVLESAVLEAS